MGFGRSTEIHYQHDAGFTLVETMIAAMVMIILCVGVFTVIDQAIKLNTGNNMRSQAATVLQKEAELYRAYKYVPVDPDPELNGHELLLLDDPVLSADGTPFDVYVTIDNDPYTAGVQTIDDIPEDGCQFKEITIEAKLSNPQTGWLSDLKTKLVFQRVRLIN